jgi:3'-5' exoribonuclease
MVTATLAQQIESRAICDLKDGDSLDQVLLARERELRQTRNGADFMRLQLADRTGVVTALVWDDIAQASDTVHIGSPVRVIGAFSEHPRYGPQLTIHAVITPLEVDWDLLLDGPATPIGELEHRLDALLETVRDRHLRALVDDLLGASTASGRTFRRAFAAQHNHHAYRAGLLEHSIQVAQATSAATEIFAGVDRDLAVCGALLHDIGKLDAYSGHGCGVTLNDAGKLIGEIPSGYYIVRRAIEHVRGFPPERAQALLHIILAHHGCLEHGSPVVPLTREALLVHTMDRLSGDLGSFERLQRETPDGEAWSTVRPRARPLGPHIR